MAPSAGHLVHMPGHVYIRTGDYDAAVKTNLAAANADATYVRASGVQGIYPGMYYSHNLHFIAFAASMDGNFAQAKSGADRLFAHVNPMIHDMPMLEGFLTIPTAVLVRFDRWNDVLTTRRPDANLKVATIFWHYARGMALAATGKADYGERRDNRSVLLFATRQTRRKT